MSDNGKRFITATEFAIESYSLLHAIQTGIAFELELGGDHGCTPKHLRVGVNNALIEVSALGRLLIAKGIITDSEYFSYILDGLRAEKARFTESLSKQLGRPVTLE